MSDFLKSALNYFNVEPSALRNDFIGQVVEIGSLKLRIKSLIAEGGFAFVYEAQDVAQGDLYALKRLFGADKEACNNIIKEITIHKQVSGHPNIVKFITASLVDRTKSANGLAEYLLVTELCTGGSLLDYINETIEPENVLKIFYQASQAIKHLHFQTPPINHRDIKIENFLFGSDGILKLCDFGSSTTDVIQPDPSWNANARNTVEDKLATFTTPMYRAPEQLDTWENHIIGVKTDVWALGCMLYLLCFQKHPFEDSAKLRIINGNYTIPQNSSYNCFHPIIKGCLQTNPQNRFDISTVLERLAAISESLQWNLRGPIKLRAKVKTPPQPEPKLDVIVNQEIKKNIPERPEPPKDIRMAPPNIQNQYMQQSSNGLFSSLKGGAGSFLKNLKDTSSKVMQSVQQTIQKTDLDISYITSRIMVMPCPTEGLESTYKTNHIDNIKSFLDSKYKPSNISIYNFGPRSTPRLPPPIRTVEGSVIYFPAPPRAPTLRGLYNIVEDIYGFLAADVKNVVIIQSADGGRSIAATIITALFLYAKLITEPEDGMQMFAVKRIPPNMKPSEIRYLYYMSDVLRSKPNLPHFKKVTLSSLTITPIPRMTKAKDGCRMFIEVICNDKIILNTLDDYEKMRLYYCSEGKITLNLNLIVCGDVCVSLYHARNTLGGIGGKPHGIKVCQFQLNTGYIHEQETLISYDKSELDSIVDDQFSSNLNVSMSILVGNEENQPSVAPPWINDKHMKNIPMVLFGSEMEYKENVDNFVTAQKPVLSAPTRPAPPKPAPPKTNGPPPRPAAPSPVMISKNTQNQLDSQPDILQNTTESNVSATSETFDLLNLNQSSENGIGSGSSIPAVNGSATTTTTTTSTTSTRSAAFQNIASHFQTAKEMSFDLLGFGRSESIEKKAPPETQTNPNIDLLGGIPNTNNVQANVNLLGNLSFTSSSGVAGNKSTQQNTTTATSTKTFDPFDNLFQSNVPQSKPFPSEAQTKSDNNIPTDPFADLVNLSGKKSTTENQQTNQQQNFFNPTQTIPTKILPTASPSTSHNTTPTHQARSPQDGAQAKPDYNRSYFADSNKEQNKGNSNNKAAAGGGGTGGVGGFGDIFADILGEQGYSFGNKIQQPRTINDMRKEDLVKEMDPERVKIMEWTEGKKGNIRALLCSMHSILWSEAKWNKCEMHQLVNVSEVKKAYRKACLAVHPDKHVGTENEILSKMIFVELNNAWSDFENDSQQQNLFNN